jgi:hypothetical protein
MSTGSYSSRSAIGQAEQMQIVQAPQLARQLIAAKHMIDEGAAIGGAGMVLRHRRE